MVEATIIAEAPRSDGDDAMAEPAHKRMIVADFLEFDDGTDHRYELIHGEIVAMAPPLDAHGTVVMNIGAAVHARLRPATTVVPTFVDELLAACG